MSTKTGMSLRITRVVNVPPERVFRAWTEPEQLEKWSCPEGATVDRVEADLAVGGRYKIYMTGSEGQKHTAFGVYREIDRPRRLVYTWDWEEKEYAVGETIVTVQFNDMGGSTEVVLTHELFPDGEAKKGHEEGWTSCLNRLERLFA